MTKKMVRSTRDSNGDLIAATVVIKDGALMTASGKREIANWLRRQARFLEKHGDELAPRYTGTWRYS